MFNDYQNYNFTGFTDFSDNNSFGYEDFGMTDGLYDMGNDIGSHLENDQCAGLGNGYDIPYHCSSEAGGSDQPYTGVEVLGDPSSFPYFGNATTAPASLCPENPLLGEGESCSHTQDRCSEAYSSTTDSYANDFTIPPSTGHKLSPIPTSYGDCKSCLLLSNQIPNTHVI